MIIFEYVNKFHPNTGKPIKVKIAKELRCDFTGRVIDDDCCYVRYLLDYEDRDACFGASGEEFEFGQKYEIEMAPFLSAAYDFYQEPLGYHAEQEMMRKYLKEQEESSIVFSFAEMCRASRIATASRLLEEKIITPDQLYDIE